MKEKISLEHLKELLDYNSETGKFIWKVRRNSRGGKIKPGVEAGTLTIGSKGKKHYIQIYIYAKKYYAHRLAWFYMTGEWLKGEVDHIDGNTLNNKWKNFRKSNRSQNACNSEKYLKAESGLKGAYYNKKTNQWFSQISVDCKSKYLGTFKSPEDAHEAYKLACKQYYGEFGKPIYEQVTV